MKTSLTLLAAGLLTSFAAAAALPGDAAEGKRLHDANCMKCHDTAVYEKERRKIRTLDGLRDQIGGCTHMAGAGFSTEQAQSVLKYLNDSFYRLN